MLPWKTRHLPSTAAVKCPASPHLAPTAAKFLSGLKRRSSK